MVIAKLAEITDALGQIDDKTRGGPIEAQAWNTLVGAVQTLVGVVRDQDLARNDALAASYAAADHGHEGEVTERWLDPALAARLSGAGGLDARKDVTALSRQVAALSAEVAGLRETVETQRREADRAVVDRIDIRREFDDVLPRLGEIDTVRGSLSGIDTRLDAISKDIALARDLSQRLTDTAGNPIDLAVLSARVDEAAGLRDALAGIDGEVLRMRDVELRLSQIESVAGLDSAGSALDDRFAVLGSDLDAKLTASVADAAAANRSALGAEMDDRFATFARDRDTAFQSFRSETDAQITAAVADAEIRVAASVGPAVAEAGAGIETRLQTVLDQNLEVQRQALQRQVMTATRVAVAPLSAEITAAVRSATDALIDTRIAEITTSLDDRLGTMDTRLARLDSDIADAVGGMVAEIQPLLETVALDAVARQTETLRATLTDTLQTAIGDAVAAESADLALQIDQRLDERLAAVDGRIDATVDARLAGLEDGIAQIVDTRIAGLDIDTRFAVLARAQQDNLSAAIASAESRLRADQTQLLNESFKTLRAEIESSRVAAINEATLIAKDTDRMVVADTGTTFVTR